MSKAVKHKLVTEQISGENFKYYKFLSYEVFKDSKTGKTIKLPKNSKIVYTLITNQFARLVTTGNFVNDENNNKFIYLNTKELATSLDVTEQTIKNKVKYLSSINLIVTKKGNLVSVPFPEVTNPKSTFVDKNGNVKLTYSLIPKYLVEHSYYNELNENALLYYSFVRERFIQSFQNNANGTKKYVDLKGNTCCWFTNEEAQQLLDISEDTLIKDRDTLYAKGLIKSEKDRKALTYRVYEPIALPIENKENTVKENQNKVRKSEKLELENEKLELENLKVRADNFEKLELSNTVLSNTSNINTEYNDLYDMSTNTKESIEKETNQSNHQSSVIEYNNYQKKQLVKYLPEFLGSYLTNFELDEIVIIKNNLFTAKKAYFNDLDKITSEGTFIFRNEKTEYTVEDLETELQSLFSRIHGKRSKDKESIENMANTGYLFQCIKNVFTDAYNDFYDVKDLFINHLKQAKTAKQINQKLLQTHYTKKQTTLSDEQKSISKKVYTTSEELDAMGVGLSFEG